MLPIHRAYCTYLNCTTLSDIQHCTHHEKSVIRLCIFVFLFFFFFFQAEDGIRDLYVIGVQTCALPISSPWIVASRETSRFSPLRCARSSICARASVRRLASGAIMSSSFATASCTLATFSPSIMMRSEERRVGKECRSRWALHH